MARRWSEEEQVRALVLLQQEGGNASRVSAATGIPRGTLIGWKQGKGVPRAVRERATLLGGPLAELWEGVVRAALRELTPEKLAAANAQQLATIAGIAQDKARALQGLPSAVVATVDMTDEEAAARLGVLLERARARRAAEGPDGGDDGGGGPGGAVAMDDAGGAG